ncbi:MAG TPA: hypothetical protein VFA50_08530 [Stellaceae bacterium]|nr:hypothetical protein [Stellaceae bacterium]
MILRALCGLCGLAFLLTACNAWQNRAEFAPPESRWPATQPSPVELNAPPPPIRSVHCYRTLAQVDCFAEKQPERYDGFTGTYPTN